MDKALQLVKEHLLGENWELNWTVLEGRSTGLEQLEEALSTAPFASPRRVVILREAMEFWKTWHKRQGERTVHALTRHPSHTLLILHQPGKMERDEGKDRESAALLEIFQEPHLKVVDFTGTRRDLERWVKKRLKKEGLPVEQEVVDWLLDVSQEKMALLETELEKFILWGRKGEDVERAPSLWDVPVLVYRRDPRLLSHLEHLMAERGYLYFFRILSSSIARMAAARQAMEEGLMSREKAVNGVCRFPKEKRAMEEALRRLTLARSMELLELAMEAEVALKSSPLPPTRVLERLVGDLIGKG